MLTKLYFRFYLNQLPSGDDFKQSGTLTVQGEGAVFLCLTPFVNVLSLAMVLFYLYAVKWFMRTCCFGGDFHFFPTKSCGLASFLAIANEVMELQVYMPIPEATSAARTDLNDFKTTGCGRFFLPDAA